MEIRSYLRLLVCKNLGCEAKLDSVETIYVHEHIRGHLAELYDNDCIFDKFHCATVQMRIIITGSYNDIVVFMMKFELMLH